MTQPTFSSGEKEKDKEQKGNFTNKWDVGCSSWQYTEVNDQRSGSIPMVKSDGAAISKNFSLHGIYHVLLTLSIKREATLPYLLF